MYQCSKKLVTYKEYSCFDHSDFPGHSMCTFDVCKTPVTSETELFSTLANG